jgi:hypothetical protein
MAGWLVLSRLKYDPVTRHIPVHVISLDEDYRRGLALGADSYLEKSVDNSALKDTFDKIGRSVKPSIRYLLVLDEQEQRRKDLISLIGDGQDIFIASLGDIGEALKMLEARHFDCVVLSPTIEGIPMPELVEKIQKQAGHIELPIIVYSPAPLAAVEEDELKRVASTAVVKVVRTKEKLLEETAVFLNRREEDLSDEQRRMIENSRLRDRMLAGGKILIVDDDIRNIFALTSGLERHKLHVLNAESGRAGIQILNENPDIDLVLMDIMMPEMDGYETIRAIREIPEFRSLPIIALTAKAMKGDREKCIDAGASDYIPKPVVLEELVSLLRVWLPQTQEHPSFEGTRDND